MIKRPPVCRYTWLLKKCEISGCQKSHPKICKEPKCFELDEDLPFWKSSGCVNWHGSSKSKKPKDEKAISIKQKPNPKQKKEPNKAKKSGSSVKLVNSKSKGNPSQNLSRKNTSRFPQPYAQPQQMQHQWNWHQSGNGQAPWRPLHRDGNNQWGNQKVPYNMVVRGSSPMTTSELLQQQFQKMTQLFNQVLKEQPQWA